MALFVPSCLHQFCMYGAEILCFLIPPGRRGRCFKRAVAEVAAAGFKFVYLIMKMMMPIHILLNVDSSFEYFSSYCSLSVPSEEYPL